MNIQITPKKTDGAERLLEISVPVETVRDEEDKAVRRYAHNARLPGFRPGKAPVAVVRKKFADAIRQEMLESIVQAAYQEALEQQQLKPIAQPHVHDLKFEDGKPLTFELHLEVRPEIALPRTGGFRVARTDSAVAEAQVNEQLEQLRDQRGTWAPSEEKPAPGDLVTVNLSSANEAGVLPEGKEYRLVLGSGQAIAGIEELIMEAAPGQTVERPVKWPDDFPDEAQRGKTKLTRVTLTEAKRKALPDLDDALAREVGDFDSLDALRKAVRQDLEAAAVRQAEADLRSKLLDEIIGANPFDVPQSWVNQLVQAYGEAYQIPEPERERFGNEFRAMAERQVRRDLVIDTLAEQEKLSASESEVDDRVAALAAKRNAKPGEVYAGLQKAGRLREIERNIVEDKVFAWLTERNTIE
jgi:trigger factor